MHRLRQLEWLWKYYGPSWFAFRLGYLLQLRLGCLRRRLPVRAWHQLPLTELLTNPSLADPKTYLDYRLGEVPHFFFTPLQAESYRPYFSAWDREGESPLSIADELMQGQMRYFEHIPATVGFPPRWHVNPFSEEHAPQEHHWSDIHDYAHGDIKVIWEPSRFAFAYCLVRAYWRTGDESYPEVFWRIVEHWRANNPPQRGANWKCGQEIAFRIMAWCFGLHGFLQSKATTAQRVADLAQMIAVSGHRIEANLRYALSQQNNHGISEAAGLWTIGTLFPEFQAASRWRKRGRQILEELGSTLIYEDGSFCQHSVNYHRLMLHVYLWVVRLAQLRGEPFSQDLQGRIRIAGDFLYRIQDRESGQVPYYGQNDGALVLPLDNCEYHDFRPVVQAIHYLMAGKRRYRAGPWDEDLLWLFGPEALGAVADLQERVDLEAEEGGYYTLRSETGFLFTRCGRFRHRPGQADMLHVDLWWRGQNIALDAGTYSYNTPAPWDNPLASTTYHNTVTVDGQDQMERVGKFLWLPWIRGQLHKCSVGDRLTCLLCEHDGYRRCQAPVSYRRAIWRLEDDNWLVLDALKSSSPHTYRLHWLLPDLTYEWDEEHGRLQLHTPRGLYHILLGGSTNPHTSTLVTASPMTPRGWQAPYYHYREPALSLDYVQEANVAYCWTFLGPDLPSIETRIETLCVRLENKQFSFNLDLFDHPFVIGRQA